MALRDAGWRIVNLACGLGRPAERTRREAELREACDLAGYELRLPPDPISSASACDPAEARTRLRDLTAAEIGALDPAIVVSPGRGDRHPAHRLLAESVEAALSALPSPPRWWSWELWGSPVRPTLGTLFGRSRLEEILAALGAHRGELRRNDYRRLVRGRAEMNAVLAPELLFGFGAAAPQGGRYAELLTETVEVDGRWLPGAPRWLDAEAPLVAPRGPGPPPARS